MRVDFFLDSCLTLAYVTYHDIRGIDAYNDQTVVAIKAPPETRLEVPDPSQEIQIWLKSTQGPIEVFLCPEDSVGSSIDSQSSVPSPSTSCVSDGAALGAMLPAVDVDSPSKSSMSTATCSEESNDSFKGGQLF